MKSSLTSKDVKHKVESLLSRMSIDQKIGQMTQTERMSCTPEDVKNFHLGSVLSGGGSCPGDNRPNDWVEMNDAYWTASMEESDQHLAIPIIYGIDAIHGNNNVLGATIFPHNIGLGAADDPELLHRIAKATAREILATGVEWTFAPTLAVARNNRWGRTYESYSDRNVITSTYAEQFVRGLQSSDDEDGVVACVKHWVGDGGTTNGIDQGETTLSFDELKRTHITPYYPAIDAGVMTIMVSFNSWNGDKCHGHKYLISDLLKKEMRFDGFVISDWDGIDYLSEDYFEAVGKGVNAGIDMFMVSEEWRPFISHLKTHVRNGSVPLSRIDDAVRRILTVKYASGLFEVPCPSQRRWSNHSSFGSHEHREIAREAVRKSLVLLKNDNGCLPLDKQARILVAGKNAHNRGHQCGGFTVDWQGVLNNKKIEGGTSIWEGIQQQTSQAVLDESGLSADPEKHDVAIVVIGELPYAEGMGDIRDGNDSIIEAGSQIRGLMKVLEPYGHTTELAELHPEDLRTIKHIADQGIPVVTVLISGRPLVVNKELADSESFIAAWLPGSEGQGVADVLFGDYGFQGKLSFSWPKNTEVNSCNDEPLFPYGYGLN
ncbi:glycoside hydrolase family 3 protein [bacterium SCSIO 12696]|nr:glycoside hydrolase family 3 protein [bacterium SCSIO 12696]